MRKVWRIRKNVVNLQLSADEEAEIIRAIDDNWEELNRLIDAVFAGKKIQIKRIK